MCKTTLFGTICTTIVQPPFRIEHPEMDHHNEGSPTGLFDATSTKSRFSAKWITSGLPVIQESSGESVTNHKLASQYLSIVQEVRARLQKLLWIAPSFGAAAFPTTVSDTVRTQLHLYKQRCG